MNSKTAIKSRLLTPADLIPGTHVICVYKDPYGATSAYNGLIGYIDEVEWIDKTTNCYSHYTVKDSNGIYIGDEAGWANLSSFEVIIDEQDELPKPTVIVLDELSTSKNVDPIIIAESLPIKSDKPCPAYYYGASACTCGGCRDKYRGY